MNINRRTILYGVGAAATALYIKECVHVWRVLTAYQKRLDSIEPTKDEIEKLKKQYESEASFVGYKEYQKELKDVEKVVQERDEIYGITPEAVDKVYKVSRESVAFLGGGRAALLQLAHPYISAGIAQHSNIKFGVQERFYNTFKHVFALAFGDWNAAKSSSQAVRSLHVKVKGKVGEDVGYFKKDHEFSANNLHALYWVHATLVETAIFMYELMVNEITYEEKCAYLIHSKKMAQTFGIPPSFIPSDWDEFIRQYGIMLKSDVLTVSSDASEIKKFLFKPPKPRYGPLMSTVEWSTLVLLPAKTAQEYYRKATLLDKILFVLFHGYVKMIYGLLPHSFRWLSPYFAMQKRLGKSFSLPQETSMAISSRIANFGLARLMPPRDADTFISNRKLPNRHS